MAKRQKPSRPATRSTDVSFARRLVRVEAAIGRLTRSRVNVRREEHDEVLAALEELRRHTTELERHTRDLEVHFTRIAPLQADVNAMEIAREKAK